MPKGKLRGAIQGAQYGIRQGFSAVNRVGGAILQAPITAGNSLLAKSAKIRRHRKKVEARRAARSGSGAGFLSGTNKLFNFIERKL